MKTKINALLFCLLSLCASVHSKAQSPQTGASLNAVIKAHQTSNALVYTYKIFQAPNKLYGYNIFRNGRGAFHQTVVAKASDELALGTIENAKKAAALSIQKLKNNSSPALSKQEIKQITAQ